MSLQKKGKEYETELCVQIYNRTEHQLLPIPVGWSGNHAIPSPDLVIDDGQNIHAIELKRTSNERFSFTYDPEDNDDISQLLQFTKEHPGNVIPYLAIRFTHRQLIVAKIWTESTEGKMLDSIALTAPTECKRTHADNISFRKPPSLSDDPENGWPSAKAGDDIEYLLETIGYTSGPDPDPASKAEAD